MYSYDRTANTTELKALSPKFDRALTKALRESKLPKEKEALQEAVKHWQQVIDNLEVAEYEFEGAFKEAAGYQDLERPAQDLVNLSRDLYRTVGRLEVAAKRAKQVHPELSAGVLRWVAQIDSLARQLSMMIDENLGID